MIDIHQMILMVSKVSPERALIVPPPAQVEANMLVVGGERPRASNIIDRRLINQFGHRSEPAASRSVPAVLLWILILAAPSGA